MKEKETDNQAPEIPKPETDFWKDVKYESEKQASER